MNVQIWDAKAVTYSTNPTLLTSDAMKVINTDGYFSLQWKITGAGTVTFYVFTSNDNATFLNVNPTIASAQTVSTGVSGANMAEVIMVPAKFCKIQASVTVGDVVINAWFYGVERVSA